MIRFNLRYFVLFMLLLIVEVLIAKFFNDWFVRAFLGDVLVVILIYTFIMTFFNWQPKKVAIGVLIFAFVVEFAQYFKLNSLLGLENNKMANIILGSTFDWLDLLAYSIGFLVILIVESRKRLLLK